MTDDTESWCTASCIRVFSVDCSNSDPKFTVDFFYTKVKFGSSCLETTEVRM